MDRVLGVDNGMFVDEVFHLIEKINDQLIKQQHLMNRIVFVPVIKTSRSVLSLPGVAGDCNCTVSPSRPDEPAFVETGCDCGTKCEFINGPAG